MSDVDSTASPTADKPDPGPGTTPATPAAGKPAKPGKPAPDFPLFPHAAFRNSPRPPRLRCTLNLCIAPHPRS